MMLRTKRPASGPAISVASEPRPELIAVFAGFARDLRPVMAPAAMAAPELVAAPVARDRALPQMLVLLRSRLRTSSSPWSATSAAVAAASATFWARISSALSRLTAVSYLPASGLIDWTIARSLSVTGPRRLYGGLIRVR